MTLGEGLYAFLSTLSVGEHVYPNKLPQNVDLSDGAITWQVVSGPSQVTAHSDAHSGTAPVGDRFLRGRVQVSVWARTAEQRSQLGDEAMGALDAFSGLMGSLPVGSCFVVLWFDDHDEKRNIYRRLIDVMMQYTLTAGS